MELIAEIKKPCASSQPEKLLLASAKCMRRFRHKQRQKILDNLAALPDSAIDISDIPELTEEQFGRAIRQVYRPN